MTYSKGSQTSPVMLGPWQPALQSEETIFGLRVGDGAGFGSAQKVWSEGQNWNFSGI